MKILLTGTSGFLGNALAKHWAASHELQLIPGRKDFSQKLREAQSSDWLVHCGFEVAFRPDLAVIERNLASAKAVSDFVASGRAKNLLFVSAAGAIGVSEKPVPRCESNFGLTSPGYEAYRDTAYIQAKIRAENLFREAGIPLTVVYPTTVIGPGMPPETLRGLVSGRACPPGGTSFLALSDFLVAMDKALSAPSRGEGYILNGGNILFSDLFRFAREAAKSAQPFFTLPRAARHLLRAGRLFSGNSFLSLSVIESTFGYKYYSAEKFYRDFSWRPSAGALASVESALRGEKLV